MVTHDKNSSRSTAGHAIFSQVAIPRLGRHLLTFSVHEWAPLDGETDAQVRITTATAHNYFDIVAGEAAKLAVLSQPPEGSIAGVFGDEAADLYPFPRVGLADAFLNLITKKFARDDRSCNCSLVCRRHGYSCARASIGVLVRR